jgi:YYY domain-containing protein
MWWLALEGLGLAALPLTVRLFQALPDRGYPLAKAVGLLITGYFFWLLCSLHILDNTWGTILLVVVLLAAGCWLPRRAWRQYGLAVFREQWRLVLATEILFIGLLLMLLAVLAYSARGVTAEKLIDFGFLNAILRSRYFPLVDPWMSGYTIRYYYFGHVLMALLARLTGTSPGIAYTLSTATFFVLTGSGTCSVVYNLVAGRGGRLAVAFLFGVLGAGFVLVIGNLEGFLELAYAQGWGSPAFWRWLYVAADTGGLFPPHVWPTSSMPGDYGWWWRAEHVIPGAISEFPLFSYLVADAHAHVMALPFGVLAVALGLAWLRTPAPVSDAGPTPASGTVRAWLARCQRLWPVGLSPWVPLLVGALGFLNSWDFPSYGLLIIGAYATWAYTSVGRRGWHWVLRVAHYAVVLVGLGIAFYLPYYLQSGIQTRGIGVVAGEYTSLAHLVIFFGPFLLLAVLLVLDTWWPKRELNAVGTLGIVAAILVPAVLPVAWRVVNLLNAGSGPAESLGDPGEPLAKLTHLLFYTILAAVALWALLCVIQKPRVGSSDLTSDRFVRLLIATVALLLLVCETFSVRDAAGDRSNTVFKLYLQIWVMLAAAAAYGLYTLPRRWPRWAGAAVLAGAAALILAALCYPLLAVPYKSGYFRGQPTLDSTDWMAEPYPGEQTAIRWLNEHVAGTPVILETSIGTSDCGRISAMTGLPTVLGQGGLERQWRGEYPDQREIDVIDIYRSNSPERAQALLDKYDVTYVYIGSLERWNYSPKVLTKFGTFMDAVYDAGGVTIYKRR